MVAHLSLSVQSQPDSDSGDGTDNSRPTQAGGEIEPLDKPCNTRLGIATQYSEKWVGRCNYKLQRECATADRNSRLESRGSYQLTLDRRCYLFVFPANGNLSVMFFCMLHSPREHVHGLVITLAITSELL